MMAGRQQPRVLVVDDDVVTGRTLQLILHRAGFHATTASDAAQALSHINQDRPDLVLLDVNLPDANGLDFCRGLCKSSGGHLPILFISADNRVATIVGGFEAGAVDYIPKPFSGAEVIARVSTHLRLKQATDSLVELQTERIRRLADAQETLMPQASDLPQARFSVSLKQMLPAGGDFYDVIPVGGPVMDYVVADASGHDLAAAFWTGALKILLDEHASSINTPQQVLRSLNRAMCRILPPGAFFTLLYARLNRQSGQLTLINAGHPPAILLASDGSPGRVLYQEGDVLGAFADATFEYTELKLRPKDRFFLFSDGLIETQGTRENGLTRLTQACTSGRGVDLEANVRAAFDHVRGEEAAKDDMLLLGVEV